MKLAAPSEVAGGDATIAANINEHVATTTSDFAFAVPPPPAPVRDSLPAPLATSLAADVGRKRGTPFQMEGGKSVTNKSGEALCRTFNLGRCSGNGRCRDNRGAHQCWLRLKSDHGSCDPGKCLSSDGSAYQSSKRARRWCWPR